MSETKKRGDIGICPNCGAPYQPGMGKCPECGHIFQNVQSNHSAQILADKLGQLISKHKDAYDDGEVLSRNVEIGNCIMTFPIPSDKEDLIEFITTLDAGRKTSVGWAKAYNAKYKECILKAQVMFPGDPQIDMLIKLTNKIGLFGRFRIWWSSLGSFMKSWLPFMLVIVVFFFYLFYSTDKTKEEIEDKITTQLETLSNEISNLPSPTKDNCSDCASSIEHIIWMPVNTEFSDGRGGDDVEALNTLQERAIRSFILKKNSYIKRVNASGLVPPLQEDTISNYGY